MWCLISWVNIPIWCNSRNRVFQWLIIRLFTVNTRFWIILKSSQTVFIVLRADSNLQVGFTLWCRCLIKYNIVLSQEGRAQNNSGGRRISKVLGNYWMAPLVFWFRIIFKYIRIKENVLKFQCKIINYTFCICISIVNIDLKWLASEISLSAYTFEKTSGWGRTV